jgi:hypothetical protein
MVDALFLRPSLHFTPLVDTSLFPFKLYTSTLHYTSLHFTTLSLRLTSFKYPTAATTYGYRILVNPVQMEAVNSPETLEQ